jgi:dolichyl-phosphate-mannose-protein mannosyltransferase
VARGARAAERCGVTAAARRVPASALVFAAALVLYGASVAPSVHWGDSAELSRRALALDLSPSARGYPLHRALCWVAWKIAGDAALGANCVSALFGAVTAALVFETARRLAGSVRAGVAAAAAAGLAHTFWSYSGVAEVYTLHTAFLAGALLLAVAADAGGARCRFLLGVLLGLSLLHHRMIAFAVPGLLLWVATGAPAGRRVRALAEVAAGGIAGAVPFVVLCAAAPPTAPAGAAGGFGWWFRDVFMGGDRNAAFVLGEGRKGLAASAGYLARWVLFNLPGPALLLAALGVASAPRRVAACLGVLVAASLWFPLRYDWTGDQYAFLVPLYPVTAVAAALGVARIERSRGTRAATGAAIACAAAPVALYAAVGWTGLAERMLPGLAPDAARRTVLPVHTGDRTADAWCRRRLASLPQGARLHADWGDGQVYLYLQDAEGLRRDVRVDVWNVSIRLGDGRGEEWVSALPFTREPPRPVRDVLPRLEARGDGLYRVRAE